MWIGRPGLCCVFEALLHFFPLILQQPLVCRAPRRRFPLRPAAFREPHANRPGPAVAKLLSESIRGPRCSRKLGAQEGQRDPVGSGSCCEQRGPSSRLAGAIIIGIHNRHRDQSQTGGRRAGARPAPVARRPEMTAGARGPADKQTGRGGDPRRACRPAGRSCVPLIRGRAIDLSRRSRWPGPGGQQQSGRPASRPTARAGHINHCAQDDYF